MCLSCFPWTWTQYDDPLDNLPEQRVWKREGSSWALVKAHLKLEPFPISHTKNTTTNKAPKKEERNPKKK
ncbi:hypothetical protein CP533_1329 [Ophiocordyceps camponoti-saundersi (nom. inval.)]|nr:hypothetical protein CP533_1329 [Ophiocordyceps camponoti-saundersi (nom. inval.)]